MLLFVCALLFGFAPRCLAIDNSEPLAMPVIPMVRAMGNAFTAVANDENAVFYNPAGYALIEESTISIFSLGIRANIDDSAIDVYEAIIQGTDVTSSSNISSYLSDTILAIGIAGPLYFGRVGDNFGFAFYENFSFRLKTRPGAFFPDADLQLYNDVGFVGGLAAELPFLENLYTGFNLKVILRVKSELEGTVIDVTDSLSNTSELPLAKSVGFGGDFGLLYAPLPWLFCGIAAKDFFGTRFNNWENLSQAEATFPKSSIKPRIAFGVALYPLKTTGESDYFKNFVIALDYSDLLVYTSMLSHIKIGVSFTTLKIMTLRGGFDGGYLTGGIGFKLGIFYLDIAYFVDELGAYPGASPVQSLMLNFALRW